MKRVLLTGMSGVGKSTVVRELKERGYKAVDTDYGGWSHWVDVETGRPAAAPAEGDDAWESLDWVWREDRIERLLAMEDGAVLFLAGTSPNQGKFRDQFDLIVLLSAPPEVLVERLTRRKNNPYGTTPKSLARVLEHVETVEPLLRKSAHHEIDTSAPLEEVVEALLQLVSATRRR